MATYMEIQRYVKRHYGFTPKNCWVAHVKEMCGLHPRPAWNRAGRGRAVPCPLERVAPIRRALRHFGMI